MEEAKTVQAAGQPDQAIVILKTVAERYPADKTPWIRMAQIKFDGGSYGEAIIDAQEALQRDPADKVANSIVTVSSLRLATKSLADLQTQNELNGSVKTEAQDLTKILRESLGETALVPPPAKSAAASRRRMPHKAAAAAPGATSNAAAPAAPTAAAPGKESSAGGGNPFGGLR
ncbi:MAG TPA: hypothetical protein VGN04_07225 [Herbaspirillum sp.]